LHDEVWRLDRIAKDGALHKKLIKADIVTVEDFLRLLVKDPQRLRSVRIYLVFNFFHKEFSIFFFEFDRCLFSVTYFVVHNVDSWEWNVQQDVGEHNGACKDMCLGREALYLLH
jgi:hypothetical protein